MASSLVDMSRIPACNRRGNEDFRVMLKRKLRLPLWPKNELITCFYGTVIDEYEDHCMSCRRHCKTPMHNKIRDGLSKVLEQL